MIGETVQWKQSVEGAKDRKGNPVVTFADPVPLQNVGVDYGQTDDIRRDGGVTTFADLVLFAPPGFECSTSDRFIVRGKEYEVMGVVNRLTSMFTGETFPTEIKLKRYGS